MFVPEESYCSYDNSEDTFSINTATIPTIEVEEPYDATENVLQSGLESEATFTPSLLWLGNQNNDFALIKISAIAKGYIYELPGTCPAQWNGSTSSTVIYTWGDRVSYLGREYFCERDATSANRPTDTYYWTYIGDCDKLYHDPIGGGIVVQELETRVLEPVLDWEWACRYDTWTTYGNPQPNYYRNDSVTYGDKVYVCVALYAYPDDMPGYSSAWSLTGQTWSRAATTQSEGTPPEARPRHTSI